MRAWMKKCMALALCAALCLGLAACGENAAPSTASGANAPGFEGEEACSTKIHGTMDAGNS